MVDLEGELLNTKWEKLSTKVFNKSLNNIYQCYQIYTRNLLTTGKTILWKKYFVKTTYNFFNPQNYKYSIR